METSADRIRSLWRGALPPHCATREQRDAARRRLEKYASLTNYRRYSIHRVRKCVDGDVDYREYATLWEVRYLSPHNERHGFNPVPMLEFDTANEAATEIELRMNALDNDTDNEVDPTRAAHWSQYVK